MRAWKKVEPDHFAGGLYAWIHKNDVSIVEVYGKQASEGAGVLITSLSGDRKFIKARNGKDALAKARSYMRKNRRG